MKITIRLFVILLLVSNKIFCQFNYKVVSDINVSNYYFYKKINDTNNFVNALNYLPKGYSKNADFDYTKEIQKAINENRNIVLPNFPILINKNGLKIPSNRSVIFQNKSKIIFKGLAAKKLNDILKIYDAKNVSIINAKIEGSKNIKDQYGEWSAGISIINSENVTISNALIKDTWGDGIFIGSENGKFSKNIVLKNIWIDNARRNGISITSLINGYINNVLISNTNGTAPECGIDIEPSLFEEYIQNVNFTNLYTFNNKNYAFVINLSALNSDNQIYNKEITVNINNITDKNSNGFIDLGLNNYNKKFTPKGKITINKGVTFSKKHDTQFDLSKKNILIKLIKNGIEKR